MATASKWFDSLLLDIVARAEAKQPLVVGINGCQGSGKSTLSDYLKLSLQEVHQLRCIVLSLDDFYLTRTERQTLAAEVHPLFKTRGVPGTHDVPMLREALMALRTGAEGSTVELPRFNKANDDRVPISEWQQVNLPVDVVLLEGWCLGAVAQAESELIEPINELENVEDKEGLWRRHVNKALKSGLETLYEDIDLWIMLAAPSFQCVFDWRLEQEQKLIEKQKASGINAVGSDRTMNEQEVARFIAHYERLTLHCLAALPNKVNHLYQLNQAREVISHQFKEDS